ncbi:uncharacterized protein MELLADRAFT_58823 [Melampsora larici-populina 98AG31]|uniref:Uncharacterized protein n=1 Tax=Melampsora larici-populina (strain 98AG31 / pathotype 3-4-7) TaxID=747676 RepID=F4R2Y3_MELLP|nr:uncharacterized protein MELLADRAFT_58823 [Melampsora larici-populina 98AG31]EGG12906.1 hypothetical protein MELLADRAFT_58823 [Melampsora larici-populina 98AG31]
MIKSTSFDQSSSLPSTQLPSFKTPSKSKSKSKSTLSSMHHPHDTPLQHHSFDYQPPLHSSSPLSSNRFLQPNHFPSKPSPFGNQSIKPKPLIKRSMKPSSHAGSESISNVRLRKRGFNTPNPSSQIFPSSPTSFSLLPSSPSRSTNTCNLLDEFMSSPAPRSKAITFTSQCKSPVPSSESEKVSLSQRLASQGFVFSLFIQIKTYFITYISVDFISVQASWDTVNRAIQYLLEPLQHQTNPLLDFTHLVTLIKLIDSVPSASPKRPTEVEKPFHQVINGVPFTFAASLIPASSPTPMSERPRTTNKPSQQRNPKQKRLKIESDLDGSVKVVTVGENDEEEEEGRFHKSTRPKFSSPPVSHCKPVNRNGLVSAEVARYGRIAITAEVMVNQLGLKAAKEAISRASDGHPTDGNLKSSPNPPDASALDWFIVGKQKIFKADQGPTLVVPSTPSGPSFSMTDDQSTFWKSLSQSSINLHRSQNPFLSPSPAIFSSDSNIPLNPQPNHSLRQSFNPFPNHTRLSNALSTQTQSYITSSYQLPEEDICFKPGSFHQTETFVAPLIVKETDENSTPKDSQPYQIHRSRFDYSPCSPLRHHQLRNPNQNPSQKICLFEDIDEPIDFFTNSSPVARLGEIDPNRLNQLRGSSPSPFV